MDQENNTIQKRFRTYYVDVSNNYIRAIRSDIQMLASMTAGVAGVFLLLYGSNMIAANSIMGVATILFGVCCLTFSKMSRV